MRRVITSRNLDEVAGTLNGIHEAGVKTDTYRERLIKYIPVETLALFVAVYGSAYAALSTEPWFSLIARWILTGGIAVTVLYLWKIETVTDIIQLTISTIGFVVWVFALGVVPVSELPWYNQIIAALVLPAYIFLAPLVEGIPERF